MELDKNTTMLALNLNAQKDYLIQLGDALSSSSNPHLHQVGEILSESSTVVSLLEHGLEVILQR